MTDLFRGELRDFLKARVTAARQTIDRMQEDETLARTTDDIVDQLVGLARLEHLTIGADPVDGGVTETQVETYDHFDRRRYNVPGLRIHAIYEFSGNPELFRYAPSTRLLTNFRASIGNGRITVQTQQAGSTADAASTKQALEREIGDIRKMAANSAADVRAFNQSLDGQLRPAVERRKKFLQDRRDLAGALGFPMTKRTDAPAPVPLKRKALGARRTSPTSPRAPYRDEPALTEAQYEDAVTVISSALVSMERTPSVVAGKDEEDLRDYILVMLNGTFEGNTTGETFVKSGKTDVLVRVEDRHVFVGECKWWKGPKALGEAIDQLLGYLPWRDEKAALIVFIDNKDATAVFEKVELAVRDHPAFKRVGKASPDGTRRRNFVLGHPEDREREIQLAALFAVVREE